jgi:Tol biopolymer transport system component
LVQRESGIWSLALDPDGEPSGEATFVGEGTAPRHVAASPDGSRLAFTRFSMRSNLWTIPVSRDTGAATGPPVQLTRGTQLRNQLAAFSPDGRRIAYQTARQGSGREIWLIDPDGGRQSYLVSDAAYSWPTWLPGGRELAFVGLDGDRQEVRTIDVTTRRSRKLVDVGETWALGVELSPGGRRVAFSKPDARGVENVWVLDIENGSPRQLTFDREGAGYPAWSPDGRRVAVSIFRERNQVSQIGVVPAAGGELVQLTSERAQDFHGRWSPDGERILFARSDANIFWVSTRDGTTQQVTSYPRDAPFSFVRYPAWSPDGHQIVYEMAERSADIWLLEFE